MTKAAAFKLVCAWCKQLLGGDPTAPVISHGICHTCAAKLGVVLPPPERDEWDKPWVDLGGEG